MKRLRLGLSTCPNDTFAFHGLLNGEIRPRGFELALELTDIEELNLRLVRGEFDVAKASFALALGTSERFGVLAAGSAVGRGVGPVVLAQPGLDATQARSVLAPGASTTATLLWKLFHPRGPEPTQTVFSAIMPALARGAADLGVCIHEGRFTYADFGLQLVEDLGATWESATGLPLPLGGVLARRDLGADVQRELVACIRASLALARAQPAAALATMRDHAQEHSDAVLWRHVELYVTAETERLSAEARAALEALRRMAALAGWKVAADPLLILGE